ncbi:MAG: antitoxin Xre/MbcA/ParS toxin-binding domain-containing protein [Candidatus Kapaibacterium sp.]
MTTIAELLGGGKVLSAKVKSEIELIDMVQAGVPAAAVQWLVESLELSPEVTASIISRRTLERRLKMNRSLTGDESDRLVRIARIGALAIDAFGDRRKAITWMNRPNRALQGKTPISVISTDPGAQFVERILGRIEHGVFS